MQITTISVGLGCGGGGGGAGAGHWPSTEKLFFTVRLRSLIGGYVFTAMCLFKGGKGERGYLSQASGPWSFLCGGTQTSGPGPFRDGGL